MPENVVLNFEAELSGFKPLIDGLKEIGVLTDEQSKSFFEIEKRQQAEREKSTKQIKDQGNEIQKLSSNLQNIGKGAVGGALKQTFGQLEGAMKRMAAIPIVKQLQDLKKAGKENSDEFKKLAQQLLTADKAFNGTQASVEATTQKTVRLTTQLRELKNRISQLDEGSIEFQNLSIEAAKLEDRIGDVNARIRFLASDTRTLDAGIGVIQGFASAFAVAQGAAALFGEENEDVQKAILKVTAAISILNGLQGIQATLLKDSAARIGVTGAVMRIYAFVTNGATVATRALNAAFVATIGGAILTGLILIVTYWKDITKFIGRAKEEQDAYNKKVKEAIELSKEQQKAFDSASKSLAEMATNAQLLRDAYKTAFETKNLRAQFEAIESLQDLSESYFGTLEEGKSTVNDVQAAFEKFTKALSIEAVINDNKEKLVDLNATLIRLGRQSDAQPGLINKLEEQTQSVREYIGKLTDELNSLGGATNKKSEFKIEVLPVDRDGREIFSFEDIFSKEDIIIPVQFELPPETDPLLKQEVFDLEKINDALAERKKLQEESLALEQANQKQIEETAIQVAQNVADTVFEIQSNQRQAELDAELSKLDDQREAELANKNLTESQRFAIETKYKKQEARAKRDAFEKDKEAKYIQAIISAALAIVQSFAQLGPIGGAIAAVAVAAATAAEIAIIASQPTPQFKKGKVDIQGEGTSTSDSIHARISRGESVINAQATQRYKPELELMNRLRFDVNPNLSDITISDKLDIHKMAKLIGEEVNKNSSKYEINVDEGGASVRVKKYLSEREYMDKRYSIR